MKINQSTQSEVLYVLSFRQTQTNNHLISALCHVKIANKKGTIWCRVWCLYNWRVSFKLIKNFVSRCFVVQTSFIWLPFARTFLLSVIFCVRFKLFDVKLHLTVRSFIARAGNKVSLEVNKEKNIKVTQKAKRR